MIACTSYLLKPPGKEHENAQLAKAVNVVVDAFMFFDVDGSGYIMKDEVMKVMESGDMMSPHSDSRGSRPGSRKGPPQLRFDELDWDQNGRVSFKEFLFGMESWVGMETEEEE